MFARSHLVLVASLIAFVPSIASAEDTTPTNNGNSLQIHSRCSIPEKGLLQTSLGKKLSDDFAKLGFKSSKIKVKLKKLDTPDTPAPSTIDLKELFKGTTITSTPVTCVAAPCPPQLAITELSDVTFQACKVRFQISAKYQYKPDVAAGSTEKATKVKGELNGSLDVAGLVTPGGKEGKKE